MRSLIDANTAWYDSYLRRRQTDDVTRMLLLAFGAGATFGAQR